MKLCNIQFSSHFQVARVFLCYFLDDVGLHVCVCERVNINTLPNKCPTFTCFAKPQLLQKLFTSLIFTFRTHTVLGESFKHDKNLITGIFV